MEDLKDIELYSQTENVKLERLLIAYILRQDYSITAKLKKEYFTLRVHQLLYEFSSTAKSTVNKELIKDFLAKKIVKNSKREEVNESVKKIFNIKLEEISDKKMIMTVVENLHTHFMLRSTIQMATNIVDKAKEKDLDSVKSEVRNFLALDNSSTIQTGDWIEDFDERIDHIMYLRDNASKFGCRTGIKQVDDIIGTLKPSEFGIVLGDTGVGKSIMVENFAISNYLYDDKNIFFASLEMPKMQVMNRADSHIAEIMYKGFRTGEMSDKDIKKWKKKVKEMQKSFKNKFVASYMRRATSTDEIMAEAYRQQDKYKIAFDLIIIDYLNLMKPIGAKRMSKNWESMSEVSWDIKCLSQDFNDIGVPIWTPNQMKDGDVKYGKAILEHCPICLKMEQTVDDELENVIRLSFRKSRDTEDLKEDIKLIPNLNYMKISTGNESEEISGPERELK